MNVTYIQDVCDMTMTLILSIRFQTYFITSSSQPATKDRPGPIFWLRPGLGKSAGTGIKPGPGLGQDWDRDRR